jgi:hypothetical protein
MLQSGNINLAKTFSKEAGIAVPAAQMATHEHASAVISAIRARDVRPALAWCAVLSSSQLCRLWIASVLILLLGLKLGWLLGREEHRTRTSAWLEAGLGAFQQQPLWECVFSSPLFSHHCRCAYGATTLKVQ